MLNFNKKQAILIGLTLALGLGLLGCGRGPGGNANQNTNANQNQNANAAAGEINTSDWQTYRNEEYGFEVKYPNDWQFEEKFSNKKGYFISKGESKLAILPEGEFDYGLPFKEPLAEYSFIDNKKVILKQWDIENQKILIIYNFIAEIPNWIKCNNDFKNCNRLELLAENKNYSQILNKIILTFKFLNNESYCTAEPIPTEIGRNIYPINTEKYGDIGYLGELFTADDCGKYRLSKIFGVNGDNYTLWPDIMLKNEPNLNLISTLKKIGFELGDTCKNISEEKCRHWSLKKIVPIKEILKLKPFIQEIESSGCINCG